MHIMVVMAYIYIYTCIYIYICIYIYVYVLHYLYTSPGHSKLPKSCFTPLEVTKVMFYTFHHNNHYIYIYIFIYIYIYISKPFSKHASHSLYTFLKLPKSCFTFLAITTSITKIYYINNSLVKVICRLLSNKKQKRMAAKLNAKTKP